MRESILQARRVIKTYKDANAERSRVGRNESRATLFQQLLADIDTVMGDETILLDSAKMDAIHRLLIAAELANNRLDGGKTSKPAIASALRIISEDLPAAIKEEQASRDAAAESARRQEEAESVIKNPVEKIADYLRKGRIDELSPDEIVPEIVDLIKAEVGESRLTTHEKRFYDDLEKEFLLSGLPVSPGIVHLLAKSPLGKRYAELARAYEASQSKATRLPLTNMIRTISEIVRECLLNDGPDLQDLHQLFMAEDEKQLSLMLKTLVGRKLLTVRQPALDGVSLPSQADTFLQPRFDAVKRMHPNTAKSPDMGAVEASLATLRTADRDDAAPAEGQTTEALLAAQTKTIRELHFAVRLSSVLSGLVEQISLSTRSHIAVIQELTYGDAAFAERLLPAARNLQPQFAFLDRLLREKDKVLGFMLEVFGELNRIEHAKRLMKVTQVDLTYQNAIGKLAADHEKWKAEFANMRSVAESVLSVFTHRLSLEPRLGMDATQQAVGVVAKQQQQTAFLTQVAADIAQVRQALERFESSGLRLPEARLETVAADHLSLDFVVQLANRYSRRKEDFTPAIELVELLQRDGLFTPQIQSRMLHQSNVDGLLGLQKFLRDSRIRVNEDQLNRLWNVVLGTPNFELLKPLQRTLELTPDVIIAVIQNLSSSWQRSLPMLTAMFQHERATPEAFVLLVKAAKGDDALVENVFEIYDALMQNQPHLLAEFFAPTHMAALIEAIQTSEHEFTDELVLRLENSQATSGAVQAPFSPKENWAYVLQRTRQLDERGLSYVAILSEWQAAGRVGHFDDYCSTIVGRYRMAEYAYASQTNVQRAPKSTLVGEPSVVNTDRAQRDLVAPSIPLHSVDYLALSRMTDAQRGGVNLSDEEQLFLHMMRMATEIAAQSGKVLVVDSAPTPSVVLSTPTPAVLDGYTFLVMSKLAQMVAEMPRLTTDVEKRAAVEAVVRQADETVRSGFAVTEPVVRSSLAELSAFAERQRALGGAQQQVVHRELGADGVVGSRAAAF